MDIVNRGNNNKMKKKININIKYFILFFLALYALSVILIISWGLITSLKTADEFRRNVLGFPLTPTLENYFTAFQRFNVEVTLPDNRTALIPMSFQIIYSIIYSLSCALSATIVCCITAYATSKFPFKKINAVIYNIVIITMIMPIVGSLPSELLVTRALGIYNKLWGPIIMSANFLGMYYLVFYATFKVLPDSFAEAAHIDGASEIKIFTKIIMPLIRNTFFIILLIRFIAYWNDYQTPLVFIPSYPTLAYGVFLFSITTSTELSTVPMKLTASFILLVPTLILFLVFQDKLIGNMRMGGLKE